MQARPLIPLALMVGNFVIGTSIMGPAAMLNDLARSLRVSVQHASVLITAGAVVLCIGTPLISWATSRFDRRVLLASSLFVVAVAQLASAMVTSFSALLALRVVMVAAAAPFTPQAAGVVGLLSPLEKRASTISFVFLGWSLAAAFGMPLMATLASRFGHQTTFFAFGLIGFAALALLLASLPGGLKTAPLDLSSWSTLLSSRIVRSLLLLTVLLTSGQFIVFTFMGPLLKRLVHADAQTIGFVFGLYGIMGLIGNVAATRSVARLGAYRTSLLAVLAMTIGSAIWAVGASVFVPMVLGAAIWGLGFASSNSMQQARLVAAAPALAGASVALNSSFLYVGQAIGSGLGGALFARELDVANGYGAFAFMLLGLGVLWTTRPRETGRPSTAPVVALEARLPER